MTYKDTLVPGKIVDLRLNKKPVPCNRTRALEFVGSNLAMNVWRMIEPTIQGKVDLTALIEEQYPIYLGVVQELGIERKFFATLGLLAHDAPNNVRL